MFVNSCRVLVLSEVQHDFQFRSTAAARLRVVEREVCAEGVDGLVGAGPIELIHILILSVFTNADIEVARVATLKRYRAEVADEADFIVFARNVQRR